MYRTITEESISLTKDVKCNCILKIEPRSMEISIYNIILVDKSSYLGPPIIVRLHRDKNGGAWCPKQQVMRGVKEWLEIDLKTMHVISTVQTQVSVIIYS